MNKPTKILIILGLILFLIFATIGSIGFFRHFFN